MAVAAIAAPFLSLLPPDVVDTDIRLRGVGTAGHVLGTDDLGRDVLARMVWGARPALFAGLIAMFGSMVPGALVGLASGYYRGRFDAITMRLVDILLAFPPLLLAVALVAGLGPGLANAMFAVSLVGLPTYARLVRGQALGLRELDYISAARVIGARDGRIIVRHIVPNAIPPIIVIASLDVGQKIISLASLSFLGLGIQPPDSDWGAMLTRGRGLMELAPHVVLVPGLAIFLVVLSTNVIGDALRDALDPRLR
jgi:peptide/nickel transport system permease protein